MTNINNLYERVRILEDVQGELEFSIDTMFEKLIKALSGKKCKKDYVFFGELGFTDGGVNVVMRRFGIELRMVKVIGVTAAGELILDHNRTYMVDSSEEAVINKIQTNAPDADEYKLDMAWIDDYIVVTPDVELINRITMAVDYLLADEEEQVLNNQIRMAKW